MKKKYYLVLDTETATLPFATQLSKNSDEMKSVAITKPLVYDIGWVIIDRKGEIIKEQNFLVQETFFVPQIFFTAYYKAKRPIYMDLLKKGEIKVDTWDNIVALLLEDLRMADIATAFNACFDFKKAIPFTESYIDALYSAHYEQWEELQIRQCAKIINREEGEKNPDFLTPEFKLRGEVFKIADLWSIACERLVNLNRYRNYCLKNELLTNSGQFFKSSAETVYQYLLKDYKFIEDHTALSDAKIEAKILAKALKKKKVEPQIDAFPFRKLGSAVDYVLEQEPNYRQVVLNMVEGYLQTLQEGTAYYARISKMVDTLY